MQVADPGDGIKSACLVEENLRLQAVIPFNDVGVGLR